MGIWALALVPRDALHVHPLGMVHANHLALIPTLRGRWARHPKPQLQLAHQVPGPSRAELAKEGQPEKTNLTYPCQPVSFPWASRVPRLFPFPTGCTGTPASPAPSPPVSPPAPRPATPRFACSWPGRRSLAQVSRATWMPSTLCLKRPSARPGNGRFRRPPNNPKTRFFTGEGAGGPFQSRKKAKIPSKHRNGREPSAVISALLLGSLHSVELGWDACHDFTKNIPLEAAHPVQKLLIWNPCLGLPPQRSLPFASPK